MTAKQYTNFAQLLHWGIAGLIVTQFILAELAERASDQSRIVDQIALLANHKSVGITILALALVRLLWRATHTPPPLPASLPRWQRQASAATHTALYVFLFALPLSGWLMSSAASYSVSYFGWVTLPDLVAPASSLKDDLQLIHEFLAKALFAIAVLHVLAAFKHLLLDKDSVMKRMATLPGNSVFLVTAIGATYALSQSVVDDAPETEAPIVGTSDTTSANSPTPPRSDADQWQIDMASSEIRFSAEQAGAPFKGTFESWEAAIWVDSDNPANSYIDVTVDIASVQTGDADRDATLRSTEWFDTTAFPEARFETQAVSATAEGYAAAATLAIKNTATPVVFDFGVSIAGEGQVLKGTARLDRLALSVGTGDWANTETVGQYVDVSVTVVSRN